MLARQKISTTTTTILTTTTTRTRTRCEEGRKPQKSTKSAKRRKNGVVQKRWSGPLSLSSKSVSDLRFEKRKAKGTNDKRGKEKRRKKSLKN